MIENQDIRPAQVIGPLGEPLTVDGAAQGGSGRGGEWRVADDRRGARTLFAQPRGIRFVAARCRSVGHAGAARHPDSALPRPLRTPAQILIAIRHGNDLTPPSLRVHPRAEFGEPVSPCFR